MRKKRSYRAERQWKLWKSMPVTHRREKAIPALVLLSEALVWLLCFLLELCDRGNLYNIAEMLFRVLFGKRMGDQLVNIGKWMLQFMRTFADNFRDFSPFVITCAGITTAVVVLFYSLIDSKNFGIPHRTIMHYFIGSWTIPVLFTLFLVKLPFLKIFEYVGWNIMGILLACWCILQQILIILFTTLSTSYRFCIWVIVGEEQWQYKKQRGMDEHTMRYFSVWKTPHVSCAMESADLFRDKCSLMKNILCVPMKYCEKYAYKFTKTEWEQEYSYMFDYYYDHIYGAMEAVSKPSDKESREKIYAILYEFLTTFQREIASWDKMFLEPGPDARCIAMYCHSVTSAVMYAILASAVEERIGACIYILNAVLEDEEARRHQTILYFFMLHILWITGDNPTELTMNAEGIRDFDEWELEAEFLATCRNIWNLMAGKNSIQEKDAELQFDMAWETCLGYACKSDIMETMIRKREEETLKWS